MKKKWAKVMGLIVVCLTLVFLNSASLGQTDWESHFTEYLETELLPAFEAFFETGNQPALLKAARPNKMIITVTTPEGEILNDTSQMHKVFKNYNSETTNLVFEIKYVYVREVYDRKMGENDAYHIGHAVIEYRFIHPSHNHTSTMSVTARHPNMCVWGG